MNNSFEELKQQIVMQLAASAEQVQAAGFGQEVNIKKLPLIEIDLSAYPFIEEGARVFRQEGQYLIVSSENVLLYFGEIDAKDGDDTVKKDLDAFPRLTEITILLGQNNMEAIEKKLNDPMYLMGYSKEMMDGMMKSHENGHIDLEEEINKSML